MKDVFSILALGSFIFFAAQVHAAAHIFFSPFGDKATIIIQGSTRDLDALTLFDRMNLPSTETVTGFEKLFELRDESGTILLDGKCGVSKKKDGVGACRFTLFKSADGTTLQPTDPLARFSTTAQGALSQLRQIFPTESSPFFQSHDLYFQILWDESGSKFQLSYARN
ncbi:MAG: hypothetical protein AB7F86_04585 [Bdellovibrionales bacterium]